MSVTVYVHVQLQNHLTSTCRWKPSLDYCIFCHIQKIQSAKKYLTFSTDAELSYEEFQVSFERRGVTMLYPTIKHTTSNIFQVGKMNREGGGKKIIQRKYKKKDFVTHNSEICAIFIPCLKSCIFNYKFEYKNMKE